jgi:H+/Cl- antiporter ClcA
MTEQPQTQVDAATLGLVAIGGVIGAVVGAVASRLFIRADSQAIERSRARGPQGKQLSLTTILPIAIGVIGLIRQIGSLAEEK